MTWHTFRPGELRAAQFTGPLFLVTPIIPFGGKVMIHGPKTAGKTQLALTLGIAVATGGLFLGEYPCRQGGVVFLEADMTKQTLRERILNAPATDPIWFVHTEPFDVVALARQPVLPPELIAVQEATPALLIIDTLRKVHTRDEMDSITPLLVYSAWQHLFPATTLLFIHHDRKKPRDPNANIYQEEAGRGTGAWTDDIDTGIYLTRQRRTKQGDHVATMGFSKCRTSEEPAPVVLKMDEGTLLFEPTQPTARQALWTWFQHNPKATEADARKFLQSTGICGRSRSYKLVEELRASTPLWTVHSAVDGEVREK